MAKSSLLSKWRATVSMSFRWLIVGETGYFNAMSSSQLIKETLDGILLSSPILIAHMVYQFGLAYEAPLDESEDCDVDADEVGDSEDTSHFAFMLAIQSNTLLYSPCSILYPWMFLSQVNQRRS